MGAAFPQAESGGHQHGHREEYRGQHQHADAANPEPVAIHDLTVQRAARRPII